MPDLPPTLVAPSTPLSAYDFAAFFAALHGYDPFPWQERLAARACADDWPAYLKLPTASGKTAALDVAVFALAYQACRQKTENTPIAAARRVFFVVDRRVIVNEAQLRMRDAGPDAAPDAQGVAGRLNAALQRDAGDDVLATTAHWLRWLTNDPDAPALDAVELRGGIYRDDAWVRSPRQPTVVASTVDQIGSRMLFRGYGVASAALPIHAALTTHDTRILLDEAHCARPFGQTVRDVRTLLEARFAAEPVAASLAFTEMTATPPADAGDDIFALEEARDYAEGSKLRRRHDAGKPVRLAASTAKGKQWITRLAKDIVAQAERLAAGKDDQPPCRRIGIVVNRVKVAREVHRLLRKGRHAEDPCDLMIGRMRPVDRDALTARLQRVFRSGSDAAIERPNFVVATQCLEVGADFDFDGMVCQAASLDALRQRLGRLNRLGECEHARGVVVMPAEDGGAKSIDPIYGEAIKSTWDWLGEQAKEEVIDFGVRAFEARWASAVSDDADLPERLASPVVDAPTLTPAHLDLLCQTGPKPAFDVDIALHLHGPGHERQEVSVCWRADLYPPGAEVGDLKSAPARAAVRGTPPSRAECLSVPLAQFRDWLRGREIDPQAREADVEGAALTERDTRRYDEPTGNRWGLVVRGGEVRPPIDAATAVELRADDVVVLPVELGGWTMLGHLPGAPPESELETFNRRPADEEDRERRQRVRRALATLDVADIGFGQSRRRVTVRTHPHLARSADEAAVFAAEGLRPVRGGAPTAREVRAAIEARFKEDAAQAADPTPSLGDGVADRLRKLTTPGASLTAFKAGFGLVIRGPRAEPSPRSHVTGSLGDGSDRPSFDADGPVTLTDHTADVVEAVTRLIADRPELKPHTATLIESAWRHDWGKIDPRFQAMLRGVRVELAIASKRPLAKSGRPAESSDADDPSGLPRGFRHEWLSERLSASIPVAPEVDAELLHHLERTHHGHQRPFAPVIRPVEKAGPLPIDLNPLGVPLRVDAAEREAWPAQGRLGDGGGDAFWRQTRRFGWWGLAWLETQLRLADWSASARPQKRESVAHRDVAAAVKPQRAERRELVLPALDGTNPLGFLAALGTFRVLTQSEPSARMGWVFGPLGCWCPQFSFCNDVPHEVEAFAEYLYDHLTAEVGQHPLVKIGRLVRKTRKAKKNHDPVDWRVQFQTAISDDGSGEVHTEWLSAITSDGAEWGEVSRLIVARYDNFFGGAEKIIRKTSLSQLRRCFTDDWDYADGLDEGTLHLLPREDRRHAYQWHQPNGDPTKKTFGGMTGANRLAIEAYPFFTSLPVWDPSVDQYTCRTLGFRGLRAGRIFWRWPIWSDPVSIDTAASVLNLSAVQAIGREKNPGQPDDREILLATLADRGICGIRQLRRIVVSQTPNLTQSISILET